MRWSLERGHERDGNLTKRLPGDLEQGDPFPQEKSQFEGIRSACGLQTASQPCDDIWNASAVQMLEQLYEGSTTREHWVEALTGLWLP
jgi:hypothetical protein